MTPFIFRMNGMEYGKWFMHLYGLGDIHWGAHGFAKTHFLKDRDRILADDLAKVILMGDYCDYILAGDAKRFDPKSLDEESLLSMDDIAITQMQAVVKELKPIADQGKILFALYGNHDDDVRRKYHIDVHKHFCRLLGVPQAAYSALARISAKNVGSGKEVQTITIFVHHGYGGGRKRGGKVNSLDDVSGWFDYDIAMAGHVHELMRWNPVKLKLTEIDRKPTIVESERMAVITGSYLQTYTVGLYSDYGDRRMYPPTKLGCGMVKIKWDRHHCERVLVME